jgi:hypothetical protein
VCDDGLSHMLQQRCAQPHLLLADLLRVLLI